MSYLPKVFRPDQILVATFSAGLVFLVAISIWALATERSGPLQVSSCGIEALRKSAASLPRDNRVLAIVGDGVPGDFLVPDRPYNTQFAQGYDLYQGVQHAIKNPNYSAVLGNISILSIDDGGNPRCAKMIAEFLGSEPRIVGVIGHSTTSTTREALPFYTRSNIPVIVPAATNPDLFNKGSSNLFRLPSNDRIQSLVIADVVLTHLDADSVFIIWDATPEAAQYSEYLKTHIAHYLNKEALWGSHRNRPPAIEGAYPISLNPLNYSYLFKRIVSSEPDVVIFAGYGSLAREFLLGLDAEYSIHEAVLRPTVVLTDGSKIPGIKSYGFDTYVTFAAAPLATFPAFDKYDRQPKISLYEQLWMHESFEVFGYDAMVLFLTVIDSLRLAGDGVSRAAVLEAIRTERGRRPTAYSYAFDETGDNVNHRYYCYSLAGAEPAFTYDDEAVANLLRQIQGGPRE